MKNTEHLGAYQVMSLRALEKWSPRKTVVLWGEEKSRQGWNFLLAGNGTLCLALRQGGNLKVERNKNPTPKGHGDMCSREIPTPSAMARNDTAGMGWSTKQKTPPESQCFRGRKLLNFLFQMIKFRGAEKFT